MKRILSLIIVSLFTMGIFAQTEETQQAAPAVIKVGYLSYDAAFKAMPDYAVVQQKMETLRKQYDDELKSAEKEFNDKYELFLEQQASMALAIREKRQSELQLMLENNVAFRQESQRLLAQAEKEALNPLQTKLQDVLNNIGNARAYLFIINTDANACPFINAASAEDITDDVIAELTK